MLALTQSCHFHIGLVLFLCVYTNWKEIGRGSFKSFSFQSIFTRKHSSVEHPSNCGGYGANLNGLHFYTWQNRGNEFMNKW